MSILTSNSLVLVLGTTSRTDLQLREPDMVDVEAGTVAWIGERGAVEVSLDALTAPIDLACRLHVGSRAKAPEAFGIEVTPFGVADVVLPDGTTVIAKATAWRLAREVCALPDAI